MFSVVLGSLDLMESPYSVTVIDNETPGRVRIWLDIEVDVDGDVHRDLVDKRRLIEAELNQASYASSIGSGVAWITLDVKASAGSDVVRYQVRQGRITIPRDQLGGEEMAAGWIQGALLELECLPFTAGEPLELGPFALSGASPTVHIDGIPGDEPALIEMRIRDLSDGVTINRIRWGARSLPELEDGEFDPVLPVSASGAGSEGEDDDTFLGVAAGIATVTDWATIGHALGEADAAASGLFDIYGRVRDGASPLAAPQLSTATVTAGINLVQTTRRGSKSEGWTNDEGVDFDLPTVAGRTLFMKIHRRTGSNTVDPKWTLVEDIQISANERSSLYIQENAPSQTGSGPISFSGSSVGHYIAIEEWAGLEPSGALDQKASSSHASGTSHTTGTTPETTQAYGLVQRMWTLEEAYAAFPGGTFLYNAPSSGGVSTPFSLSSYSIVNALDEYSGPVTTDASGRSANLIAAFKAAAAVPPSLPAGTYTIWVTAIDAGSGSESGASLPASVTLSVVSGVLLTWAPPESGDYTGFRVYWKRDTEPIKYIDTGSTGLSFLLDDEADADGEADPPLLALSGSQCRLAIGLESGTTIDVLTPPVSSRLAFGRWEPMYFGRSVLSPMALPIGALPPGFRLAIQGKNATQIAQLDVDAFFTLPADEQQVDVRFWSDGLEAPGEWVFGSTPDLRSYGFIRDLDTGSEAGRLLVLGQGLIGPGNVTIAFLITVEGGVWNLADVAAELEITAIPQYRWLAGGP